MSVTSTYPQDNFPEGQTGVGREFYDLLNGSSSNWSKMTRLLGGERG